MSADARLIPLSYTRQWLFATADRLPPRGPRGSAINLRRAKAMRLPSEAHDAVYRYRLRLLELGYISQL